MSGGRPTDYTKEKADVICERLIEGESLRSICKDKDLPSTGTVCRWLIKHIEFQEQYAQARQFQADTLFDEILDIADDGSNDWMEKKDHEGNNIGWQLNGEHVQRSRLRVDSRKWMAGKMKPKKYGDKSDITSNGESIAPKDATAYILGKMKQEDLENALREAEESNES